MNPHLIDLIVKIVASHEKLDKLARCYSKNKSGATLCHAPLVACKVLFKILTNHCDAGKSAFLNQTSG